MVKVLFVTAELNPLKSTGGLGDVSKSLPHALKKAGVDVRIFFPAYKGVKDRVEVQKRFCFGNFFDFGKVEVLLTKFEGIDVPIYLLDCPKAFDRKGTPYGPSYKKGWKDNHKRFALFSKVAALIAEEGLDDWNPDVIHCQDWHAGLVAEYMKDIKEEDRPKTICSIHNIVYTGCFDADLASEIEVKANNKNKIGDCLSFLKSGINYSDIVTTVSPKHAEELTTKKYAEGLANILKTRFKNGTLTGILNGLSIEEWDPEVRIQRHYAQHKNHNSFLYAFKQRGFLQAINKEKIRIPYSKYSYADLAGKTKNKKSLQKALGLDVDKKAPIVVLLSRLDYQKGTELFYKAIDDIVAKGAQVIIHGSGFPDIESNMQKAEKKYKGRVCAEIGFNKDLEHSIYAGGDIYIAPSKYEPCGLAQMKAMLYGCIPIVRNTGGLADTVKDIEENGHGFVFEKLSVKEIVSSVSRAIELYKNDQKKWQLLIKQNMKKDFSWRHVVKDYIALYKN